MALNFEFKFSGVDSTGKTKANNLTDAVVELLNDYRTADGIRAGHQIESIVMKYKDNQSVEREIPVKEKVIAEIMTFYRRLVLEEHGS